MKFRMFACLLSTLLLVSCTTALWSPNYYSEKIDGFYLTPETLDLIVTSQNTAYIFPVTDQFANALLLSREINFHPSFPDFALDNENQISGTVRLVYRDEQSSPELLDQLHALGFRQAGLNSYVLNTHISGKKYQIQGEIPLEKLEQPVIVSIAQPLTRSDTVRKLVATPVTITYDAVVVVPLTVVVFTFVGLLSR
ncbi:MAG: hypothetical protein JJU10_09325 [Idiomarina sp.]|nr:hypothetical protein [Idiomarina sp.]